MKHKRPNLSLNVDHHLVSGAVVRIDWPDGSTEWATYVHQVGQSAFSLVRRPDGTVSEVRTTWLTPKTQEQAP